MIVLRDAKLTRIIARYASLAIVLCSILLPPKLLAGEIPGSLKGGVTVSLSGTAQYSIPISVPTGTAGMEPKLILSYDSGGGPGSLGLGWSLLGVSHISRTIRTSRFDGHPGGIEFSQNDALVLDGARLVAAPENNHFLAKVIDDQTRVEVLSDGQGPYYVARTKAGLRMYYRARIRTTDGGILTWACDRIEDTFGNAILLHYKDNGKGDWGADRIDYTENNSDPNSKLVPYASVVIAYSDDTPTVSFVGGRRIERTLVLTSVESRIHDKRFRRYEIEYEETHRLGARRISTVEEIGADIGSAETHHRATRFDYNNPSPHWQQVTGYDIPEGFTFASQFDGGYRFVDLDGSGKKSVIFTARASGRLFSSTYEFEGTAWTPKPDLAPPVSVSGADEHGTIFYDVDGSGFTDLLVARTTSGSEEKAYRLVGGTKWQKAPELAFPMDLVSNGEVRAQALSVLLPNGAKRLLTLPADGSSPKVWSFQSGQWVDQAVTNNIATQPSPNLDVFAAKVDCSADGDIVVVDKDIGTVEISKLNIAPSGSLILNSIGSETFGATITHVGQVTIGGFAHLIVDTSTPASKQLTNLQLTAAQVLKRVTIDLSGLDGTIVQSYSADVRGGTDNQLLVQLTGSAHTDIAAFSYDSASQNWMRQVNFDYSAPDDDRIGTTYVVFPTNARTSSLDDLILLPLAKVRASFALLNQSPGWTRLDQYVPDIVFSQEGKPSTQVQFIDLNGDGLVDLIGYNVDENGNVTRTAKLNTGKGWVDSPEYLPPVELTRTKAGATGILVDVRGTGVPDLLYAYGGKHLYFKNSFDPQSGRALGWVEDHSLNYAPPEDFVADNVGDLGVRFFDVTGDGRVDMVIARREADGSFYRKTYLNTGTGWKEDTSGRYLSPVPFVSRYAPDVQFENPGAGSAYYRDLRVQLMDMTGDGLLGILYWYRFMPGSPHNCLNIAKPDPRSTPASPLPPIEPKIPTGGNCAGAFLNTGNGWQPLDEQYFSPIPLDLDITDKGAAIDFVDLNGDGLVDIVPTHKVGSNNIYGVYLNKGPGWLDPSDPAAAAYKIPAEALISANKQPSHRFVDVTGDGLVDLVFAQPHAKGAKSLAIMTP